MIEEFVEEYASGLSWVGVGSLVPEFGSSMSFFCTAPITSPRTHLQQGAIKLVNYKHITKFGLTCFEEAVIDAEWKKAMDEEHMTLQRNKTWHMISP